MIQCQMTSEGERALKRINTTLNVGMYGQNQYIYFFIDERHNA